MQPEPHVEFIPFPDLDPEEPVELTEPAAVAPDDAVVDDAAAVAPDDAMVDDAAAAAAVAPDQVLAPGEPVTVIGEDHPVEADLDPGSPDDVVDPEGLDPDRDDATDPSDPSDPRAAELADLAADEPTDADAAVIDVTSQAVQVDAAQADAAVSSSDDGDPATEPQPVRVGVGAGRPAASAELGGDRPAPPEVPVADRPAGFRRWGIGGRMLLVPMTGIIVGVLLALIATVGVSTSNTVASQMGDAVVAAQAGADLRVSLSLARDAKGPLDPGLLDDLQAQSADLSAVVAAHVDESRSTALDEGVDRLVDAARAGAGDLEIDGHAATAIGLLDAVLTRVDGTRRHRLEVLDHRRDLTILSILVVLLVGSVAMLAVARGVAESIVAPVRRLGRAMRRFADGDLSARGAEGVDEVGLLARSFNYSASAMGRRIERLSADAARGTQLRMISDALDLADDEDDVYRITERALGIVVPGRAAQLLVTESTSNRLTEVAANPQRPSPACPVEAVGECVAMRRAQPVVFDSPAAINSCPRLRGRESDCAAACVPVSVNGHLLGVIHVTGAEHDPPDPESVEQLVTLAGQVGNRIGAMRTLQVTRMQASTDGLTGLANRRMLEARLADLMRNGTPFVLAVADLDRFTEINNSYGHEFGDKALQLFAGVLEENVRDRDLVARFGGEEFVLVYPEMSVKPSMEVIERIRAALARELARNDFPAFTCSFGVTHSSVGDSVESIIRIADAGLLTAKELGRNRVVYADEDLAAEVFADDATPAARALSSMRPSSDRDPDLDPDLA